jgi:hypothetical protein
MTLPTTLPTMPMNPAALRVAERLSRLPPSIQTEVIETLAALADHLIAASSYLEAGAERRKMSGETPEDSRADQQYEMAMLVYGHVYASTQIAVQGYKCLMTARKHRARKAARLQRRTG